jgi:hypothetical protein
MCFPIVVEGSNIMDIYFTFIKAWKDFLNDLLSKVRRLFDAHRQSFITKFALWHEDNTKTRTLAVEFIAISNNT